MTIDNTTMAAMFITPNAIISTINAQQQPRQNQPWLAPARKSRNGPR